MARTVSGGTMPSTPPPCHHTANKHHYNPYNGNYIRPLLLLVLLHSTVALQPHDFHEPTGIMGCNTPDWDIGSHTIPGWEQQLYPQPLWQHQWNEWQLQSRRMFCDMHQMYGTWQQRGVADLSQRQVHSWLFRPKPPYVLHK